MLAVRAHAALLLGLQVREMSTWSCSSSVHGTYFGSRECYGRHPPGEGPRARAPVDPIATFKRQARDKDLSEVELTTPQDIFFAVQDSLCLKYTLFRLVQDTVALFGEATARGIECVH